jgi:DNA-directed RNA polymerase subunit RPC12/RpoP
VSEAVAPTGSYRVDCPHCKKSFDAELLEGDAARYNGFKCPHCRLFVPFERVVEQAEPQRSGS